MNSSETSRLSVRCASAVTAGTLVAVTAAMCLLGVSAASETAVPKGVSAVALRAGPTMPTLGGAIEWINSKPLSSSELRGKVVLVDFWTFSCINWLRTAPYVMAWAAKYKDQGLVVIGVHTPEFEFEKDLASVRSATAQLQVDYPVAVDSNRAVWQAFRNAYWPALYFVDASGKVRHHHFGEGEYESSERMIQKLLLESGAQSVPTNLVQVNGQSSQAQADWDNLRSPETYVGHARASGFASPGGITRDRSHTYVAAKDWRLNKWGLSGAWTVGPEAATLDRANGRVHYRFHARDLHLVMGPATGGKPIPFRILIDGQPPGPARGSDVDDKGHGLAAERRLYQLIRQPGHVRDRLIEIEFLTPGIEAYAFTFG